MSPLNLEDVLVSESRFRVKGKGGRDRLAVLVDDQSMRIQREHIEVRSGLESESRALFLNATSTRLSTQGIANIISEFRKDAGIERHITPHMLAAYRGYYVASQSVDIRVVQEFLGRAASKS